MKEMFLVTTALEDTWPEDNQSILFLGEWCRLYSRKHLWMKLDAEVAPYHWDDRAKLYKDYKYLRELFERILSELTVELNKKHEVCHSSRYWRILIGPWLMMFLPIIYDRWVCLQSVIDKYPVTETKVHEELDLKYIPKCMEHFSNLAKSDLWNHALYASILKFLDFGKVSSIKNTRDVSSGLARYPSVKKNIVSRIKDMTLNVTSLFSQNDDYFIVKPYLSKADIIKLQFKLGQIPVIYQGGYSAELAPDQDFRRLNLSGFKYKNKFEQFVIEVVPLQLPIAYLEGYKKLAEQVNSSRWPKRPKLIWTSNSYYMDEMFKLWAAERVEEGVSLVIGQHGGHYGQGLFSFSEYHELQICDHYLSWGWKSDDDKVMPVGAVKKPVEKKKNKHSHESILFVLSGTSRYSGGISSIPISRQWIDYTDDQMKFYKNLPSHISSDTIVRLYPHDDGWSQYERWKDMFPESKIDEGKEDFNKVLADKKLLITGWNTTTYLESMMSNIPTIVFWAPKYFEIRDDAKVPFEDLKKVGILHDDPMSAVKHLESIWGDIDAWWNRADVVSVRNDFVKKYAYSNDMLSRLSSVLKDIAKR